MYISIMLLCKYLINKRTETLREKLQSLWLKNSNERSETEALVSISMQNQTRWTMDLSISILHTHTQIFTLCKIYRQSHKDRQRGEMRETEEGKKKEVTFLIECFFSSEQSRAEYKRVRWCQHTHNTLSRVLWQILLFHSCIK